MTEKVVQRGSNGNVLGGCSIVVHEMCPEGGPMSSVRMGFKGNALGGILHQDVSRGGSMVMS